MKHDPSYCACPDLVLTKMTKTRPLSLTSADADFLYEALIKHNYEQYSRKNLDVTEEFVNFLRISLSLQDRLKEMFADTAVGGTGGRRKHRNKYGKPRLARGRVR